MPLPLIQAIVPTLTIVAMVVPLVTGFHGKRLRVSVALGWGLFVLAMLVQEILLVWMTRHFPGDAWRSPPHADTSGLVPAIMCGWVFPVITHNLGDIVAGFMKRR